MSQVDSYGLILLLPTISKLFEKILFKRLRPIIEDKNRFLNHKLEFRRGKFTMEQVHRITDITERAFEGNLVYSTLISEIAHLDSNEKTNE